MSKDDSTSAKKQLTRGHKKKARTRQQLLDAALSIYARKGAAELTLSELASESGVSNGTVYNYFSSREAVLEAVGNALAEQHAMRVMQVSMGVTQGVQRLSIGVRMFIRHALENAEWASALISVIHYAESMRSAHGVFMRHDLQKGLDQGDFSFVDIDVAMSLVASATLGAMTTIVEGFTIKDHDSVIAHMILLALGVPEDKAKTTAYLPIPTQDPPQKAD